MKRANSNNPKNNDLDRARHLLRQTELLAKTGSWEYNSTSKQLKWSDGVYELLDCKPQSFEPSVRKGLKYIHPDDRDELFQKIRTYTKSEDDFTFKTRFRTKKKNVKTIHVTGNVVHDKDQKISKVFGVFQDVSLHKEAKTELNKTLFSLQERIKELSSLYRVSKLSHTANDPDILLEKAVHLLPSGWQYPEITTARIRYGQKFYETENYQETKWSQSTLRETTGSKSFEITIAYSEKRPDHDEGPFLMEERQLIETVADNLLSSLNQFETEKKLFESEQLFKALVQEGASLTAILDLDGEYQYVSPNYKTFIGYHPDELKGKNSIDLIHPDDHDSLLKKFSNLEFETRITSDPFRFKNKKGEWRWLQSIATNLLEDNIVSGIIINSVDITELIETQKELQISNDRYDYLSKATHDAIYEWDIRNDHFEFGDAFQRVFGYNQKDKTFRLSDWIALMHPADARANKKSWDQFLKTKKQVKWHKKFRFKHANGTYLYVEEIGYIIRDKKGNPIRMVGVLRDITDSKLLDLQGELKEKLSAIFTEEKGLSTTLDQVLKLITDFGDYKTGEFWLVSDNQKEIFLTNFFTQNQTPAQFYKVNPEGIRFPYGEALPGIVWKNRSLTQWHHNESNIAFIKATATHNIQLKSAIGIPLTHNENMIGVLILFSDDLTGDHWMESIILDSTASFIGAEISRKKQEEEMQLLFDSAPEIVAMAGPDDRFTKVNTAFCELLGYSEEELTSVPFTEYLHPDDLEQTAKEYHETISGERNADNFTNRYRTKDGHYKWISWVSSNVINQDGNVFAFGRDVTEVIELQNLLDTATQLARVGAWEIDIQSQKVYMSKMAKEIHELKDDFEPDLETGINFYREDVRPIILEKVEQAMSNGTPWDLELPIITAKGNERWIRSIGKTEMINDKCVKVFGSVQDIHKRKMIEQDLLTLNEMLQEYTRELEISNTELEQFAYVASHDLQEPLRMITSFMELLKTRYEDQLDDKAQQYIFYATDGAKRMRQIILDLLNFSRVGKHKDQKEIVNLTEVVDFVCKIQHKLIKDEGAVIKYSDLPEIETFRSPLVQVFQNLISNAIKYSKQDKDPLIEIISTDLKTGWQISVKDNGIGIKESYFEKIFIIFQRLHQKDEYSGTGIGLTIVKKIVDNLGGKIWVESEEGKGSTFHFTIPK